MGRPKLNMFHTWVFVIIFNELPRAKQIELETFIIIYKIVHFYALRNKCKCIMNLEHATFL
jgi:hypothetical protein